MHTDRKKAFSFIMSAIFVVVILFSIFFMAKELGHDCVGEDCPICACIDQMEQNLNRIAAGLAVGAVCVFVACQCVSVVFATSFEVPCITLISRKIRLNN